MDDKNNMEMCNLDPVLPRYYKGYDMDVLIAKMRNQESLIEAEWAIIGEAQDIYWKKEFERREKKWKEEVAHDQGLYPSARRINWHGSLSKIIEESDNEM